MEKQIYSDIVLAMKKPRLSDSPVDCVSSLPKYILARILSLVSTKEAVKTCVLSKSWRQTWALVPVLNLDIDEFFPEGHELVLNKEEIQMHEANFSKFVIGVLQNREKLQLDSFRLQWSTKRRSKYCTSALVDKCVSHATEFKPRALSIHVFISELLDQKNHNKIFACASLEEISLMVKTDKKYQLIALREVSLPRLKRLEIGYATICDDFLVNLFSGCPALEELELRECVLCTYWIHSTALKALVLRRCMTDSILYISTPELMHLKIFESENMREIFLENLPCLVDASISIPRAYYDYEFETILSNLSNASSLNLSLQHLPNSMTSQYTKKVRKQILNFPAFKNLRSLELGNMGDCEADLVVLFLRHSPNLQSLTWQHRKVEFDSDLYRLIVALKVEVKEFNRQNKWRMDARDKLLKESLARLRDLEIAAMSNSSIANN